MKKEDFIFNAELKHYSLKTDDYEVVINEKDMIDVEFSGVLEKFDNINLDG